VHISVSWNGIVTCLYHRIEYETKDDSKMKIDTVRLETKVVLSKDILSRMASEGRYNTYHNKRDYNCYMYWINGDSRLPLIKYTAENQKLTIVVPSLPRLVTGSCMVPLSNGHREQVMAALKQCLGELRIEAADPSEWIVRGLDTYHDFHVGEQYVMDYLLAISRVYIPRYKLQNDNGETVKFSCGSKEHYFYNKHQRCIDKNDTAEDIERSRGVLRYEVGYNATELSRDAHIPSLKFGDICTDEITEHLIEKYFSTVPMTNLYVSAAREMQEILTAVHGASKAIRLMGFVSAYERQALDGLDQRTIYRNLELIKQAGLAPVIGTRRLPPLRLPFLQTTEHPSPFSNLKPRPPIYRRGHMYSSPLIPVVEDPHFRVAQERLLKDIENL
jgi:hypothetical protein